MQSILRNSIQPGCRLLVRPLGTQKFVNESPSNVRRIMANERLRQQAQEAFNKKEKGLYTIPNALTLSRIAITPAIGYFILNGMNSQALACFAFAAVTDAADGFIARRFNQYSQVGEILDPIADKLLITTSVLCLCQVGLMPIWLTKSIVSRDLALLGFGAVMRYASFTKEKPTFRQFFDFKNNPQKGFEPIFTSKLNTALICALVLHDLGATQLIGDTWYKLLGTILNYSVLTTNLLSFTFYGVRFLNIRPESTIRAKRWKTASSFEDK